MKTKAHWDQTKNSQSFHTATKLALHLREYAKEQGISSKSIRVLSKEDSFHAGLFSDAAVVWPDGPHDWANKIELTPVPGVSFDTRATAVLVYDIFTAIDIKGQDD